MPGGGGGGIDALPARLSGIARRLPATWRRGGAPGLFWAALRAVGCWRLILVHRDLREAIPQVVSDPPVEVRVLERAELAEYMRSRRPSARFDPKRLDDGSICFAAWHGERLVGASWWYPGEAWDDDLERRFELEPDEVYAYDVWTAPGLRGRSIAAARAAGTLRALRERGFRRGVGIVLTDNRPMLRSMVKTGWRPFGSAGSIAIGRRRIEYLNVGGRRRWRLRRSGAEVEIERGLPLAVDAERS